jgi:hypothetical protein
MIYLRFFYLCILRISLPPPLLMVTVRKRQANLKFLDPRKYLENTAHYVNTLDKQTRCEENNINTRRVVAKSSSHVQHSGC